jgi:hypothetical protein
VLGGPGGSSGGTRTILNRHGIKIIVQQSGRIGYFDFATLLTALTASLGLLAVSGTVVLYVATMLLPQRHLYNQYINASTAITYTDLRKLPQGELSRFSTDDVVNPAPEPIVKLARKAAATGKAGSGSPGAEDAEADAALAEDFQGSRLLGPVTVGLTSSYARATESANGSLRGRYGSLGPSV